MNLSTFMKALEAFQPPIFDDRHSIELNNKRYFPLYVILYANKGIVGDAIRSFTKEPYSHSSISFDTSMNTIYTFGQRIVLNGDDTDPNDYIKKMGASIESFTKSIGKFSYPPLPRLLFM